MHFPTLRFRPLSRAVVARIFRFLALLVVDDPLRSNIHWKSRIDSAIMAGAHALRPGRGCPTAPEIVQCDPDDAAAARPALVVWRPAPGIIEFT